MPDNIRLSGSIAATPYLPETKELTIAFIFEISPPEIKKEI